MSPLARSARPLRAGLALVCLVAVVLVAPRPLAAQDSLKDSTSLKFVPADAAIYMSSLRNREKYDAVVNSKAFAKLKSMPVVQMALAQLDKQMNDPEGDLFLFKLMMEAPENKQLISVLTEMASEEIFVYGGTGYADSFGVFMELNNANQASSFAAMFGARPDPQEQMENVLAVLNKHVDKLQIPDTVIGFKIKDAKAAQTQLERLEVLIKAAIAREPMIAKSFSRKKIGDKEYLTLALNGGMIPWDEAPFDLDKYAKLIAKLKTMTFTISLGVHDNYILLSLGDNDEHLASLGQGKLLFDNDELAPLRKSTEKRISSISYASEAFIAAANSNAGTIDNLAKSLTEALPQAGLDADLEKSLTEDIKTLAADIKSFIPKPGAAMGYHFLTDRGIEGYSYNWTQNLFLDGSKPLDILNHVGGDPILFVANREKPGVSLASYDMLTKWAKKAHFYFEAIAVEQFGEEERKEYTQFRDKVLPILADADKVTRNKFLPSLKDGQSAFVFDAKLSSKEPYFKGMPAPTTALPMPDIGIVVGVSDVPLLKEAVNDYAKIVEKLVAAAREVRPNDVPEFTFPPPKSREFSTDSGKFEVYYYILPEELGVHDVIAPNAGLSSKYAALSLAPLDTKRLLEDHPPSTGGPLSKLDRPLAGAAYFNFEGLLTAAEPWVNYGGQQFLSQMADTFGGDVPPEMMAQYRMVMDQVKTGLEVARCWKDCVSVTYLEDGAIVSHSEWHFQDLK